MVLTLDELMGPKLAAVRTQMLQDQLCERVEANEEKKGQKTLEELVLHANEFMVARFVPNEACFYRKISRFSFVLAASKSTIVRHASVILRPSNIDELVLVGTRKYDATGAMAAATREFLTFSCITESYVHKKRKRNTDEKFPYWAIGNKTENKQVVTTDPAFLAKLQEHFPFDHDPCPVAPSADGMVAPWGSMNFVNPPFRHFGAFAMRAIEVAVTNGCRSILIGPASTYSAWFSAVFCSDCLHAVAMLRGDRFFTGYKHWCPFPVFLLFIGPSPKTAELKSESRAEAEHKEKKVPLFFVDPRTKTDQKRAKPSTNYSSFADIKKLLRW
jgi:hypothetical protein